MTATIPTPARFITAAAKKAVEPENTVDNSAESGIIKNIKLDDILPDKYDGTILKETAESIYQAIQNENAAQLFDTAKFVKVDSKIVLQTDSVRKGTFFDTVLNLNENALGGKTVEEIDAIFLNSKSTVANSLKDGIIHEKYHAKLIHGLNYEQVEALYDELSDIHIDGISKIALSDGAECISEVGVMIERGDENIPQEALALFKKYVGG